MVTNNSKAQLIMLFVEGLVETLCRWVRAYKSTTPMDDISRAQDMIDVEPNFGAFVPTKPTSPQGSRYICQPQRETGR